ncbi:MAG: hypothetical protein ACJART_001154, partial [Maribacter sp.]
KIFSSQDTSNQLFTTHNSKDFRKCKKVETSVRRFFS